MTEFSNQAKQLLATLKYTAGAPGPQLVLPVGCPPVAFLRPVATRPEHLNPADVSFLTAWRNRFVQSFLTEFEATEGRTARWLTQVIGPSPDKIFFMLDDLSGRTFAYMGLYLIDWEQQTGEGDSIVRGGEAPPGVMTRALATLLLWAMTTLGLRQMGVRVRSDNPALEFYRKMGFRETHRSPLRRTEEPGLIRWVFDATVQAPEVELVHMIWNPPSAPETG